MKFTCITTYDLPEPEYFKEQLGWHVETLDDVVEQLSDYNDDELRQVLGNATDYECYAELD